MHATVTELDFIEEIRLRCWARENYVPLDDREESWHPVVLDEMRMKDLETSPDEINADEINAEETNADDELVVHNDGT